MTDSRFMLGSGWSAERSLSAAALAVLLLLGTLPLIRLVVLAAFPGDSGALEQVFGVDRTSTLFWRSVAIALGTAVVAVSTGGFVGVVLARVARVPKGAFLFVLFVTFSISPYVLALGWLGGRLDSGLAGGLLGRPSAVVAALGSAFMPLSALLVYAATRMRSVASDDAAFIVAGPVRTVSRIVLPSIGPIFVVIGAVTFSLALSDYSVASLYQVPTYPIEVFLYYAGVFKPALAARASLPLLLCGLVVALTVGGLLPRIWMRREPLSGRGSWPLTRGSGLALASMSAVVMTVLVGPPVLRLFRATAELSTAKRAVLGGLEAATNSLWISILAALASVAVAWPASGLVARAGGAWRTTLFGVLLLPLFVPASAYGIAWVETTSAFGLQSRGLAGPVLCLAARLAGATCLFLAVVRSAVPAEPLEVARLHEPRSLRRVLMIDLPLLAPATMGVLGILVALNLNATSILVLTVPAGLEVLPVRTDNLLHYGLPEEAAALALAGGLLTATAMLVGLGAYHWTNRKLWTY